jgi:hypothetical protein
MVPPSMSWSLAIERLGSSPQPASQPLIWAISGVGGFDLFGEVADLRVDGVLGQDHVAHFDGLLVMGDHRMGEHDVGVVVRAGGRCRGRRGRGGRLRRRGWGGAVGPVAHTGHVIAGATGESGQSDSGRRQAELQCSGGVCG